MSCCLCLISQKLLAKFFYEILYAWCLTLNIQFNYEVAAVFLIWLTYRIQTRTGTQRVQR